MEIEGDGFRSGPLLRRNALSNWLDRWFVMVEDTQLVVDVKYLQANQHDTLRKGLCIKLAEKLLQDCAKITQENRKVTVELLGIRRKANEGTN